MAGEDDGKTEEPTQKRLADAREEGNLPLSPEVGLVATLSAVLVYGSLVLPSAGRSIVAGLETGLLEATRRPVATGADVLAALWIVGAPAAAGIAPLVGLVAVAGVAAALAQTSLQIAPGRILPDLSRVSPLGGWSRLFSRNGLMHFLLTLAKVAVVAAAAAHQFRSDHDRIVSTMRTDPGELPEIILVLSVRLLAVVTVATLAVMALDVLRARLTWRAGLRMSRQDIKDEMRQAEGDPIVRARQRSIARDRARKRMMADVKRATVVIVNPVHYAVALRYRPEEGGAPVVLAKGQDLIALKIREIAEEAGVPVVENPPLARSLAASVEVGRMIPPEFYRAVAEVIYHVHTLKGF